MSYHLNFTLRSGGYFDKLCGRARCCSLELAVVCRSSSAIVIGLGAGGRLRVGGGRSSRAVIAAYVEFIRNVPADPARLPRLLRPADGVDGFAYDATDELRHDAVALCRRLLVEVFRAGWRPCRAACSTPARRSASRPGSAWSMSGCRPCCASRCRRCRNTFISLFKDTSVASVIAVPELTYGAQWININTFRIVEVWSSSRAMYLVTGYAILLGLLRCSSAASRWALR